MPKLRKSRLSELKLPLALHYAAGNVSGNFLEARPWMYTSRQCDVP